MNRLRYGWFGTLCAVCALGMLGALCATAETAGTSKPRTVATTDGREFREAMIEGVNPGGIDIGYVNNDGVYVIQGLSFRVLPEPLRREFGYDPEKCAAFEKKVGTWRQIGLDRVAAAEAAKLARIRSAIDDRRSGGDAPLTEEELGTAIYAGRSAAELKTVAIVETGTICEVRKIIGGEPVAARYILIDGLDLPEQGTWSAFIYPTGIVSDFDAYKRVPVFCDARDKAVRVLGALLRLYDEPDTPTGVLPAPATGSPVPGATVNNTTVNNYYGDSAGYGYGNWSGNGWTYYIGGVYVPYWRFRQQWRPWPGPHPRPPQPRPPRPAPHPSPSPVPRPQPGPGPGPGRPGAVPGVSGSEYRRGAELGPLGSPVVRQQWSPQLQSGPEVRGPSGTMRIQSFGNFRQSSPAGGGRR